MAGFAGMVFWGRSMDETILLIEDNRLNLKLFQDLVAAKGCRAVDAASGSEGITLAKLHRPDIAVVDLQLPDCSGLDVIKALKSDPRLCGIPVLATSAFCASVSAEWLARHQCDGFIAKPVLAQAFISDVDRLLRRVAIAASEMPPSLSTAGPRTASI